MDLTCMKSCCLLVTSPASPHRHKHLIKTLRIMNLTAVILLMVCLHVSAASYSQNVTYTGSAVPLKEVFKAIKQQTGYVFFYTKEVLNNAVPATLSVKNRPLQEVMQQLFADQPLTYTIEDKTIFINKRTIENAAGTAVQQTAITGTVTDANGKPLSGVSVMLKGTSRGTATDSEGRFIFKNIDAANAVLVFSMLGYEKLEIALKGRTEIQVRMKQSTAAINTVEVVGNTGYQKIPRERATGSFDVITSKQLENKIQTNVLERMEGLVPGLMLINGKDNGSDDGLTIRGVSTLYGTKRPLIVIDNFPFEGTMDAINPNDVASITVLKDAAAASIWGARAANGVIVITTKNARKGKIQFAYSNSFQFEPKPDLGYLNRLNASDDIDIDRQLMFTGFESRVKNSNQAFSVFEKFYMDSVAGRISPAAYRNSVDSLRNFDNSKQIRDLLMQSPLTQNHSLSFMGGNDNNQYYGSVRYTGSRGYSLKEDDKSYSFLLKGFFNVTKKLSFNVSTNMTFGNSTAAVLSPTDIYRLKPYQLLAGANGQPLVLNRNSDPANQNNSNDFSIAQRLGWGLDDESFYPLKEIDRQENTNKSIYNRLQAEIKYAITPGIDFNVSYQLENGYTYNKIYTHPDQAQLVKEINDYIVPERNGNVIVTNADGTLKNPTFNIPKGGKLSEERTDFTAYTLRALFNVNKTIANDHEIAAVIGAESRQTKSNGNSVVKYGYDGNSLQYVDLDVQRLKNIRGTLLNIQNGFNGITDQFKFSENRFVSTFANAAYTYRKKYVLSGSVRMDATNLFGTDPKYLYRPMWSSGASWILSNENFLKGAAFVDYLQLRATYGINGNIPKNSGPFMIAESGTNYFNNLPTNTIITPANNQLRWERTAITNLGIDYNLFNYRLSGKADYYVRKSADLLGDYEINPTLGFTSAQVNTASMTNRGWEFQLTSKNIVNRNFEWNTTVSYALNRNKITKVAISSDYSTPLRLASGSPYIVGQPYGGMYSFRFGGLSHDDGQIQLLDASGKIVEDNYYYDMDMVYFTGNTRPVTTAAISNSFLYKGFDLSFMFVYYGGHYQRQSMPRALSGVSAFDNRLKDAWKKPGDEQFTHIPNVLLNSNNSYYATIYYGPYLDVNVFDASYLKLRDVSLRYTFSQQALRQLGFVRGLQLTANARNILTITKNKEGIDPEAFDRTRTMPVMPTFAFGINLDF